MNAKQFGFTMALIALNLAITIGIVFHLSPWAGGNPGSGSWEANFHKSDKYVLYIGTNDQHNNLPVMPLAEARATAEAICLKYAAGFTVVEGRGAWTNDVGQATREDTLIFIIVDIKEARLTALMDEILVSLNQSAILVEKSSPASLYYHAAK